MEFCGNFTFEVSGNFTEPDARPSHGRLMGGRVEFWRKTCLSRKTVQRYVELSGFSKFFGEKMKKTLIMQCRDDKMRCSDGLQVATVAEVAQNCGRLVGYRVIK